LKPFSATVWFKEMWSIAADPGQHFALAGDSGSLVVTEDGSAAVGLLFAASPSGDVGAIVPMTHIATCFGSITLVSGHGV